MRAPGPPDSQVNERPGVRAVTVHLTVGMRGWSMVAVAPTRRGPSCSVTLRTDGVHSGQRSASLRMSQTRCDGAPTSTPTCCSTTPPQASTVPTSAAQWRHTEVTCMPTFS